MAPFSTGLNLTCHLGLSVLDVINAYLPPIPVLGPLLFIMYTSPLSTLISSLSLNHHLYVDDTQIFFSFYAPDFPSNITFLLNALQHISSWMT